MMKRFNHIPLFMHAGFRIIYHWSAGGLRSQSATEDSPGLAATALKITAGWGISRTPSKIQHLIISGK